MVFDVGGAARPGGARPERTPERSPTRAAVLALVTLTAYGFWWWWDVNRQLRAGGAGTSPWRSLTAVTLGWLVVVPPFRSVRETTTAIAAAQRGAGRPVTAQPASAVRLAVVAAVGLALFPLSIVWPPAFFLFGGIPPAFGMLLVWYVQRELNRALG